MSRSSIWIFCLLTAFVLSIVTFTPLVIPAGEPGPSLGGLPVTLWAGIVIAFALVFLTYLAGLVHPRTNPDQTDEAHRKEHEAHP